MFYSNINIIIYRKKAGPYCYRFRAVLISKKNNNNLNLGIRPRIIIKF